MTLDQINETGAITHRGPVAGVQVHAHMEFGPYALTVPLDTKVVIQLMFMFAEQTRQEPGTDPLRVTPQTVLERLRGLGVVSGNGSRLVGRDAVYESFARLQKKGYIRRIQLRENNKAAGVAYEFYDFPAWNPEPPDLTSSQVRPASGNAGSGNAGSRDENRAKKTSSQVRPASGNAGSGNAGSRSAKTTSSQVRADSGNAVAPPHPPEEEDSSSPNPLADPPGALPSQRQQKQADVTPEEVAEAAGFLQRMGRWQAGAATARRCAPRLVRAMQAQGWPLLASLDADGRRALEAEILKNTGGATSWTKCLPGWVDDLRLYETVRPRTIPAENGDAAATRAALVAACTACDPNGWVLDDDDDGPMRRCAHPELAGAEVQR